MGIQLGPNHKDYGRPIETMPPPKPKSEHAPRSGRPPRPLPTTAQPGAIKRLLPAQLLKAYAAEHDLVFGRECPCSLCDNLRWLLASARSQREAERR